MNYQLVFQKAVSNDVADYHRLIALEAKIESFLAHGATVDGHDFGVGQGNIFIHTDYPKIISQQIFEYLLNDEDKHQLKVAFRDIEEEEYQVLWPKEATEFEVQ